METQKEADVKRVRSVVFKRSVELLLLSIEKKAEESSGNELAVVFEDILALSDLLGEVVERALDLIDSTEIKLYRSVHSSRELFEIQGETAVYRFFPKLPFCSCRAFIKQVITGEEYCCKHYIAARIAKALGKVEVIEKSLFEFRAILKQIRF